MATHHKYSDEERRGGETLFAAREHHEGQEIVVWSLKAFGGLLVFSLKLKNVFDFRRFPPALHEAAAAGWEHHAIE